MRAASMAALKTSCSDGRHRQRAGLSNAPLIPGMVAAELMFGFWTYLFADAHEKTLWGPHLHKAVPPGIDRNRLNDALAALRDFRNRVAHHVNILSGSESERRKIIFVIRLFSDDALTHFTANIDVATILAKRP